MITIPRISIIIINYNGLSDTLECLDSLKKCSYPNFEILLMDNASNENDVKELKKINIENLHFLPQKENLGFGGANNIAIKKVINENKSKYIYFLNNDTTVEPDFLKHAIDTAEKDEKIGIISSLSLQYSNPKLIENAGHKFLNCGDFIPRGRNLKKEKLQETCEILGACSANALYRTDALRECGLYDESFFLNFEDADLSLRLIIYGYKCVYEPKSIIYHKVGLSIKKIRDYKYILRSQENKLKAYAKNTPLPVIILNSPFILISWLLTIIASLIFLRFNILKIFFHSKYKFLKNLSTILKERKEILKNRRVSSFYIWKNQKLFILPYLSYFKKLLTR
jgi:GT2 family glycosyltransferase